MSIPLLQGRFFTREEAATPNSNAIVSRSAAAKLWPGQNALGRRIRPRFGNHDTLTFTVVGIGGDVKQNDWRESPEYWSAWRRPSRRRVSWERCSMT